MISEEDSSTLGEDSIISGEKETTEVVCAADQTASIPYNDVPRSYFDL